MSICSFCTKNTIYSCVVLIRFITDRMDFKHVSAVFFNSDTDRHGQQLQLFSLPN